MNSMVFFLKKIGNQKCSLFFLFKQKPIFKNCKQNIPTYLSFTLMLCIWCLEKILKKEKKKSLLSSTLMLYVPIGGFKNHFPLVLGCFSLRLYLVPEKVLRKEKN